MARQSAHFVPAEPEARTPKTVSLRRAFKTFTPRELHVVSGDQVIWEIDSIGANQSLVVESVDPRFPFHVRGARGASRVKLDVSYSGFKEITVPYSVSLQDASGVKTRFQDEPMAPTLVIDSSGPPPTVGGPPPPPPRPSMQTALRRFKGRDDEA
jgi:hypothetical protein